MWAEIAVWMLAKSDLNWFILPPTKVPVGPVSGWIYCGGGAYCDGGICAVGPSKLGSWFTIWVSSIEGGVTTSSSDRDGNTYSWTLEQELKIKVINISEKFF